MRQDEQRVGGDYSRAGDVTLVTRVTGAKDDAVQCRVHLGLIDKTKLLRNVVSID